MTSITAATGASGLYRIAEFSDVFADACLRDSEGQFKFLSIYGRDGSLMQFFAAMQLGAREGGIARFSLVDGDGNRHPVEVGAVERLDKFSGRLPRQNLFGPLVQTWIHDKCLLTQDRANRIGWVIHTDHTAADASLESMAWELAKRLSPVALLEHWREPLCTWCRDKLAFEAVGSERYPPLGSVRAMRVSLSDHFVRHLSDGVRTGVLTL